MGTMITEQKKKQLYFYVSTLLANHKHQFEDYMTLVSSLMLTG